MSSHHYQFDGNLTDSSWKQSIIWEFISELATGDEFSLKDLLRWCCQHLRVSQATDNPSAWQDEVEWLLWALEEAGLLKRVTSHFSGIPRFYRLSEPSFT